MTISIDSGWFCPMYLPRPDSLLAMAVDMFSAMVTKREPSGCQQVIADEIHVPGLEGTTCKVRYST